MANFIETNDTIQLIHAGERLYSFKTSNKNEKLAEVKREFFKDKQRITISAGKGLATYIIEAFPNGYRYQHAILNKEEGQQVFHWDNVAHAVREYKNGELIHSEQRLFDTEQNICRISQFDLLDNGEKIYRTFIMSEGNKSATSYSIFNTNGSQKEEGTLDTNGHKNGPITTYNNQGEAEITYYENGKKLSLGQRILRFKFWKSLFVLTALGTLIAPMPQKVAKDNPYLSYAQTQKQLSR